MMEILNYGSSCVSGVSPANRVRFWVESRTRIVDEKNGTHEDYYQCGSCKSENTFGEKDLFLKHNYDFIEIFGPEHSVIFRRTAELNPGYRDTRPSREWWGGQVYRLREAKGVRLLETNAAIRKATHDGLPLVARTELWNKKTRLRAIIEYPVKTMNILDEKDRYQVDTGPVAWPDLSLRTERSADMLSLAFVAFNAPHFADFVIEAPTPILKDGKELCSIHHYSKIVSLPAKNTLYATGD